MLFRSFFALFCLLSLVWTFFIVPETKGRTLEQMDVVFKDAGGAEEIKRRAKIERRITQQSYSVSVET